MPHVLWRWSIDPLSQKKKKKKERVYGLVRPNRIGSPVWFVLGVDRDLVKLEVAGNRGWREGFLAAAFAPMDPSWEVKIRAARGLQFANPHMHITYF